MSSDKAKVLARLQTFSLDFQFISSVVLTMFYDGVPVQQDFVGVFWFFNVINIIASIFLA